MNPDGRVSLGILAGGRAARLNGADKAFARFDGQYLCQRIASRLENAFARKLVSARGHDPRFAAMKLHPVLDARTEFSGPLAGIEALLKAAETEFLLTLPVDIRHVPSSVIESWLADPQAPGFVLRDAEGLQPLIALWHVATALPVVGDALDRQERAVHTVILRLNLQTTSRTDIHVGNLNTPEDFETT